MVISPDNYLYDVSGKYVWTQNRVIAAWARAYAELQKQLQTKNYSAVILLVGIPGAGKSFWLQYNQESDKIYFDATFTSAKARRPAIQMAQKFDVPIEAVILLTSLEVCKQRNNVREPDRRVPDETLCRMAQKMVAGRPRREEGFSKITFVQSNREI